MKIVLILLLSFSLSFAIAPAKINLNSIENKISNAKEYPKNSRTWAFIIGIEEYDSAEPVLYSENSARTFELLVKKSFGVKQENIFMLINDEATTIQINDKLKQLVTKVKSGDTVLFYFSGNSFEDIKQNNEAYLRSFYDTKDAKSLKLKSLYKKLTSSKANKIIVFLDTVFSKDIKVSNKKMVVFLAGRDKESSNFYEKEKHRLLSYFFMQGIADMEYRNIDKLFDYVRKNVAKISKELDAKNKQTPKLSGNSGISF